MIPDKYLDLTIGGSGGAGTQADPYKAFADVPTYAGGGSNNILVIGSATLSGTQTIKSGYNYFSRTRQRVGDLGSECTFGLSNDAYATTLKNLDLWGNWSDSNDITELTTLDYCRLFRAMTAGNRFFHVHRPFTFNHSWFAGGCASPSNNQSAFIQASLGNNLPFPKLIFNRCSLYVKAAGIDGSETLGSVSYITERFYDCLAHFIDRNGQMSASAGFDTISNCYYAGDMTFGTQADGDDIGFLDPERYNLELGEHSQFAA